jgi:hypothetical protein
VSARLTKAKPAKMMPVRRPTFQPCWTEAKAVEMANDHLAPNAVANAGYRLAMVILARPVERFMEGTLASSDDAEGGPAECVCRILMEAEGDLKSRLEVLRAAQARVLWSAAFVHGVEMPKGERCRP